MIFRRFLAAARSFLRSAFGPRIAGSPFFLVVKVPLVQQDQTIVCAQPEKMKIHIQNKTERH